jgi:hypothetical protein
MEFDLFLKNVRLGVTEAPRRGAPACRPRGGVFACPVRCRAVGVTGRL